MSDVSFATSEKIVYTNHIMAIFDQSIAEMRSKEASTAGD